LKVGGKKTNKTDNLPKSKGWPDKKKIECTLPLLRGGEFHKKNPEVTKRESKGNLQKEKKKSGRLNNKD